jgi:hypothetical protein
MGERRAAITPADETRAGAPARPPAVFFASIPLAYLVSSPAARLSWLALVVLNPAVGVLVRRRAPRV